MSGPVKIYSREEIALLDVGHEPPSSKITLGICQICGRPAFNKHRPMSLCLDCWQTSRHKLAAARAPSPSLERAHAFRQRLGYGICESGFEKPDEEDE